MNIVLIGMRGAGKSTVGRILARRLKKKFLEMDNLIIKKAGMTVPRMVQKYGWEYFRDLESGVCKKVAKLDNRVVSTGGGVVIRQENVKMLKKNGLIFLLVASLDRLLKRIGEDESRPSLTGTNSRREDMRRVLAQRRKLYIEAADEVIDTNKLTTKEVAEVIDLVLKQPRKER
ncbi:shikimate kinase [Candidatus Microgenomates bacterium]|nr:shikimate kinase [Candidatus Microgenomates bacterium]